MNLILSILTPAIPKRMLQLSELCESIETQIAELPIEHLALVDNRKRTIGQKRDDLLRLAKGRYVAFVDDDDEILPDYARLILEATMHDPDVITFDQESVIDGQVGTINFRLGQPNELFQPGGITRRNAWHVCAWKRTIALQSSFPASNYGEDWAFASKLCALPGLKEVHIDKALHRYRFNSSTTAAPPPLTYPKI